MKTNTKLAIGGGILLLWWLFRRRASSGAADPTYLPGSGDGPPSDGGPTPAGPSTIDVMLSIGGPTVNVAGAASSGYQPGLLPGQPANLLDPAGLGLPGLGSQPQYRTVV